MPLHGKIVVVKRSGGDGTEFPLTASCLFGRKPDCDIRIQLPQVSKEHCRIDLNENKEVILTNLSSVNPTCVNGEVLQQPERLKNGDVITIVDRSFRFEYPPAPTPKKSIKGSKGTTPDHHLKDGTNHNIQRSLEQTKGEDPTEDADTQQSKTVSPFNELYQMIRESLGVKTTPYKSAGVRIQTPLRKSNVSTKGTPKVAEATVSRAEAESENTSNAIPTSDLKRRTSDVKTPAKNAANIKPDASSPQTRQRVTPQTLNVSDVAERVCTPTPKSPMRRRSKEATPPKQHDKVMSSPQNTKSPGVIGKGVPKKRKSEELDSPASQTKKKRVSFGGYLVPELFDKKMPPDSPLRKGENPRRSLCLSRPKQSLLRRASIIGLLNVAESPTKKSSGSPKVSQKKSTKGSSPSPGKKSPKSRTPPHKSPKSTPAKSPSPSTPSASRCSSEMTLPWTPLPKSAKSTPTSSQRASPAIKSLKPNMLSAIVTMLGDKTPKSRSSPTFSEKTSKTPSTKSPKSTPVSPKLLSLTPKLNTQSVEASLLVEKSPKWRSSYPASSEATSKLSTPRRRSSSSKKLETPLTVGPSCKETPTSTKRASPRPSTQGMGNKTPATTPLGSQMNVSSAQGRFSISRIETPSPMAEVATVDPAQSATVTPKIPLRRKSMKSSARKTSLAKSAIRVMIRRSGISRASMKAITSWADTVKFGQVKVQPPFPAKKIVKSNLATTRVVKKMVSRPQTPRRKQLAHASTGHAESPVTIVIGRAFKQKVTPPTGAAPKVTCNTLISKENMKMDEDLSGITEMFKTPVKEAERRSEANKSTTKGPLLVNEPSVLEPSVLNTPEEPGEMVVSPLTLASTRKAGRYNKEAVKRLLNCSQEFSFNSDLSGMQTRNDSVEEQCTGVKASDVATPKQKPQPPECLTGVRRLMKTPRQKAEPAEDLGGKLLKTPKQKIEQQECLTGVKRMMRTPRQKTEPVEDLRGKLLKTPKQQSEQKECLTGVKRIFNTLKQSECIRGVSIVGQNWKEGEVADVSLSGIPDLLDTAAKDSHNLPTPATESQDLPEQTKSATPGVSNSPIANLAGTKRVMKTPKQKSAPVEDIFGIERLMKTPKVRSEPVEENFGIKQLMKSPRLRGRAPLEDFEGLQELMEEPVEFKDQPASCYLDETKGQPEEIVSSGVTRDMPQVDITKEITEVLAEVPNVASESSDTEEAVSQTVIEDAPRVTEMDMASLESANTMKSVQGERTKVEDEPMGTKSSSDPVVSAPVRGRRGKNVERTEPPAEEAVAAPKTKRGKYARKVETVQQTLPEPEIEQSLPVDNEPAMNNSVGSLEKEAVKPRRGRYAKKVERVQQVAPATFPEPEIEHSLPVDIEPATNNSVGPLEKEAVKPRRGRYAKKVETVQQVAPATFPEPEIEHSLPVDIEPAMNKGVKPLGKEAVKPRRGRSAKKASEQIEKVPEAAAEALSEPDSEPSPSENIEHLMSDSSTPLEKVAARPKRCAKNASEPIETTALAATETLPEPKSEQTLAVDSEPVIDQSVAPLESESVKPKRGRYPKKVLEQTETIPVAPTEILPEPDIEPPVNENMAPLEEAVKPKRGRKPKHFSQSKEAQISSCSDVSQDNTAQVLESGGDHEELMPSEDQENKSSDPAKGLLEVKTATEKDLVVVQKPVRGRRGKLVEDTVEEEKQDAAFEEPHVSAPVRARRGKRTEATAPPAIRQSTRNRNAKTKEGASDAQSATVPEKDSELNLVTETSETYTRQDDVKKSDEDLVKKPGRGRRAKQTPIEPLQPKLEKTPESEQLFVSEQPLLPAPTDKTGRGKNVISETVELEELVEDEVISEETKLQSKPLARTRGRNAKHKKELDNSDSTSTLAHSLLQEIKTSSDQTVDVENPVQVQVDAPQLSEPEHMSENTSSSTKTRRGVVGKLKQEAVAPGLPESPDGPIETPTEKPKRGRRTKQVEDRTAPEKPEETNIGTRRGAGKATQEVAVESAENNDGPVETPTEKPKRGSRAKQVVTTSEVKEKPEPEQKRQRGRGLKANLENETPQVVPAKRARRGPAPASEEPKEVPEPASVEPVKRGRLQKLLRSVNWNPEVEVHEVPKRSTRVVRGKRSSPSDDAETRSQSESENADKTEEDLSEKAVESQPAKRARRGAKVANEAESTSKVATKEAQDTQAQPKTRKGRSAKK